MRHYCTYFDHNYLARALVLLRSLRRWSAEPLTLWVLVLNQEAERLVALLGLEDVRAIPLGALEAEFPELLVAKGNRKLVEYYFTLTPALPLYLFSKEAQIQQVSYVDADMCFFGDTRQIFDAIADASIAITPHRFPEHLQEWEKCGRFNVGWLTFRRDEQGLACLERWKAQCQEWCYDRVEDGKFGDQAYLDEWPALYSNLCVLEHPGINAAIWNIGQWPLSRGKQGLEIGGSQMLLYHFHGFKAISPQVYDSMMRLFRVPHSRLLNELVYAPYLRDWLKEAATLREHQREAPSGYLRNALTGDSWVRAIGQRVSQVAGRVLGGWLANAVRCCADWMSANVEAVSGQHFIVWKTRVVRLPWRV